MNKAIRMIKPQIAAVYNKIQMAVLFTKMMTQYSLRCRQAVYHISHYNYTATSAGSAKTSNVISKSLRHDF